MVSNELVELAQKVASVRVSASALGEHGVAATLQMALDELLAEFPVEREGLALVNSELAIEGDE